MLDDDKKIVLAVDDMSMNLRTIKVALERYFDVRLAKSGQLALSVLGNIRVDLILLDIEMPGMSGFEFLHQIRKIPALMSTPVIIVTSHSGKEFSDHAIGEGANDVLGKPVNPQDLKNRVVQLLENPPKSRLESLFSKLPAINLN